MRLRIRGPSGQSAVTLDEDATVETLRKTIASEVALDSFDIKYGWPPKPLSLDQYAPATKLSELEVKLNGEQLIVSKSDSTPTRDLPHRSEQTASQATIRENKLSSAGPSNSLSQATSRVPESTGRALDSKSTPKSAPLSLTRKNLFDMSDPPEIILPDLGGTLVLRIMPDDNSCLFRAIASAVMSGLDTMTEMRSMVADAIQQNPDKYTKVVLDNQNPDDYCRWIQTQDAWGGQIELDILSRQFDIEICSIDVQTLRVDRYNEDAMNRCILVYSGIHYDTIAFSEFGKQVDEDIKYFGPAFKDQILPYSLELCGKLQEKHYYTDTAGFRVKCNDCGAVCIGEAGAQAHAKQTGHFDFGESN